MIFNFNEEMMKIALKANGWSIGWADWDWIAPGVNPDRGGVDLKDAFFQLLMGKNLVGKHDRKSFND